MNEHRDFIRFGIPSLDDLFGTSSISHRSLGIALAREAGEDASKMRRTAPRSLEPTRVCILGREGSGKSILALHMTARYLADSLPVCKGTRAIYLSTDLTHAKALEVWKSFRLDYPNLREAPYYRGTSLLMADTGETAEAEVVRKVGLISTTPLSRAGNRAGKSLVDYLDSEEQDAAFIDFANDPPGDAWAFANRLLAALPTPKKNEPKHLVVLDTIDGFEALVGERDEFGELSTRRARITQVIERAARKAHLLLICEDKPRQDLSEKDVSDVVVQLRVDADPSYRLRTVEVLKARAQSIERGEHVFLIRTGSGSVTGKHENPDEPRTTHSYVQAIPSFNTLSRRAMHEVTSGESTRVPIDRFAGFGLPHLDEMLGGDAQTEIPSGAPGDLHGLPYGSLSGVIGDANTLKAELGWKFLRRGFEIHAEEMIRIYKELRETRDLFKSRDTLALISLLFEPSRVPRPQEPPGTAKAIAHWLNRERGGREANWTTEQLTRQLKGAKSRGKPSGAMISLLAAWFHSVFRRYASGKLTVARDRTLDAKEKKKIETGFTAKDRSRAAGLADVIWNGPAYEERELMGDAILDAHARAGRRKRDARQRFPDIVPEGPTRFARLQNCCRNYAIMFTEESLTGSEPPIERLTECLCLQLFDESYAEVHPSVDELWLWLKERSGRFGDLSVSAISKDIAQIADAFGYFFPLTDENECPTYTRAKLCEDLGYKAGAKPKDRHVIERLCSYMITKSRKQPRENKNLEFAKWLLGLSPNSHPYSRHGVDKALVNELSEKRTTYPLLQSAMVSALLQALREGSLHFREDKSVGQELRDRVAACVTIESFNEWAQSFGGARSSKVLKICQGLAALEKTGNPASLIEALHDVFEVHPILSPGFTIFGSEETHFEFANALLESLARKQQMDGPAILVTTGEITVEELCEDYVEWLMRLADREHLSKQERVFFRDVADRHFRQWTICRRLEVHYMTSSSIGHILRRCVEAAQGILFHGGVLTRSRHDPSKIEKRSATDRAHHSWNIRLVIDGLASMKKNYPKIVDDPLFLPYLKHFVAASGVTGLVVVTQPGRPDSTGEDEFERATLNVFLNQIRTWRVVFLGEHRVAITALPPPPSIATAKVRELVHRRVGERAFELMVDPHFELYRGLEKGEASSIPLVIRLVGGVKNRAQYADNLNTLLHGAFTAYDNNQEGGTDRLVQLGWSSGKMKSFREFTRFRSDSRLDHSLVLEVDEFWAFQRSESVRRQWRFLNSVPDAVRPVATPNFYLGTLADSPSSTPQKRLDKFCWNGHHWSASWDMLSSEERNKIDRIPFMWDFGFLLCRPGAWASCRDAPLSATPKVTVGNVWDKLLKAQPAAQEKPKAQPATEDKHQKDKTTCSWRYFLEAAKVVASRVSLRSDSPIPALDIPLSGSGESLSCLILEIWASEVYQKYQLMPGAENLMPALFGRFTRRGWAPSGTRGLIGLLAEPESRGSIKQLFRRALEKGELPKLSAHSLELFKTFLLLREALDIPSLVDDGNSFNLKARHVHPQAVAARHWYSTACERLDEPEGNRDLLPVRLPGHFSVRGDWFLAVAAGSESYLLADRALDVLSSRRANMDRLQDGIGLPVRDVSEKGKMDEIRTRLRAVDSQGRYSWIKYKTLARIGANWQEALYSGQSEPSPFNLEDEFFWLWRSSLGDYDAQARVFQRSVAWFVQWWKDLSHLRNPQWRNGFVLYDNISSYQKLAKSQKEKDKKARNKIFDEFFGIQSLWEFPELCDALIAGLRKATPR
jgi:hypothetical protein